MTKILLWLTAGLAVFLASAYTLQAYVAAMRRISWRYGRGVVYVLFFAMVGLTYWAGGKGDDPDRSVPPSLACREVTLRVAPVDPPTLHGYFAPTNFDADAAVFTRPVDAETPTLWQNHSVCDDFQPVTAEHVAGICGVVTTQPYGFNDPSEIETEYDAYAPLYATNALICGLGDFWMVTNDYSKCFVWKDVAFNRDPSNLVSFASRLYDWGDVEFIYGNVPTNGFSSFIKRGEEIFDMTDLCASGQTVRLEKNLEQNTDWWLENYPEICATNESGELVFDYDTNEWYMVEFQLELETDVGQRGPTRGATRSSGMDNSQIVSITVCVNTNPVVVTVHNGEKKTNVSSLPKGQQSDTFRFPFKYGMRGHVLAKWDKISGGRIVDVYQNGNYNVQCTRLGPRSFELLRPIVMRIDNSAPSGAGYMNLSASLSPAASGGSWSWSAEGDLQIVGSSGCRADVVADGDGGGTVHCLWQKGGASATGSVHVAAGELVPGPGSRYLELSFPHPVSFFEPEHLGTNGAVVAASAPSAQMYCSYRGTLPGALTIDLAPFQSDTATLWRDGQPVSLPATYSLADAEVMSFYVVGSGHSSSEDGVEFVATFEPEIGASYSSSARVTFVEVRVEATETFPDDELRHVFGPTETVKVTVNPHGDGSVVSTFGPTFAATNAVVSVAGYSFPVTVIGPAGVVATNPRPIDPNSTTNLNFTPAAPGEIGASFMVDLHYLPDYVSFAGVDVTEGEAAASGVWGYFASHPGTVSAHDTAHGAGATVGVTNGNNGGFDHVGYSAASLVEPLSAGGWQWEIPVFWSVPGHSATNLFMTSVQTFALSPNGDFTVGKFGCSAIRGTNGVQQVTGGGN